MSSWLKQIGVGTKVQAMTDTALTSAIEAGTYDMFDWDWYSGPDPAGILGVLTCDQRDPNANTYRNSDSYFCNKQYDKLYQEQFTATDATKRADIVHQMQSILYQYEPYIVLYNAQTLQAYRSDRVTGFLPQPEKNGDLLANLRAALLHQHPARHGELHRRLRVDLGGRVDHRRAGAGDRDRWLRAAEPEAAER